MTKNPEAIKENIDKFKYIKPKFYIKRSYNQSQKTLGERFLTHDKELISTIYNVFYTFF